MVWYRSAPTTGDLRNHQNAFVSGTQTGLRAQSLTSTTPGSSAHITTPTPAIAPLLLFFPLFRLVHPLLCPPFPLFPFFALVALMYRHMPLQLVRPRKALATARMRTRKGPLAGMCADMFGEIGSFDKTLAAMGADERFLAIVRALSRQYLWHRQADPQLHPYRQS